MCKRFSNRHLKHIGNAVAMIAYRQRFRVVAFAVTSVALYPDIWQEVHFDNQFSVTFTIIAATS